MTNMLRVALLTGVLMGPALLTAGPLDEVLLALERGQPAEALRLGELALASSPPDDSRAALLLAMANAYQALGHYPEANDRLNTAGALVEATPDPLDDLLYLSGLGDYLLAVGQSEPAEQALKKGLEIARPLKQPLLLARLLNNYGNLHMVAWSFEVARESYREALALAQEAGDTGLAADILFNQAQMAFRAGQLAEATDYARDALEATRGLPSGPSRATGLVAVGRLCFRIKSADANQAGELLKWAAEAFTEAAAWAEIHDQPAILSFANGFRGQLYEYQNRFKEAQSLTWKALYQAQRLAAPEHLYLWQWQAGRLARKQGLPGEAISHYRQAVETLRTVRVDLNRGLRNAPESFRELIGPVYTELADLLLRESEKTRDAGQQRELLLAARNTIEAMKTAEMQNLLQDACLAAQTNGKKDFDQVEPGTAIYYPVLLEDRLEILLTTNRGMQRVTVPVAVKELEEETRQFRLKLEETGNPSYLVHAQRLYRWLIQPVQAQLAAEQVDNLVVVPDGVLRTIPLAALHDGQGFLAEKLSVAVIPGLQLTDTKAMARQDLQILVNALTEGVQGFVPLPNVNQEVARIRKIMPGEIYQDEQFTLENILAAFDKHPTPIVHIASHGQFDRDPQKNFLLTYDGKLTIDKLEQMIRKGRFRDQPVELLTLSACQTAVGDDRAALGLAGVAVKAGARSVLATLWFIDDEATSLLIANFYQHLVHEGMSKVKALQASQRDLIQHDKLRHPGFWASFILIGNWS